MRSVANNLYVCAEKGGASDLIANRTAIGPWEKFNYTIHGYFAKTSDQDFEAAQGVSLYPNPAGDRLHVQGLEPGDNLRVYDRRGLLLMQAEGVDELDISSLAAGSYLLKAGDRQTLRFVKN